MSDLRVKYFDGIQEVAATARRTAELGFVTSHGGNISARLDENVVAITPTKVPKRKVHDADVVLIDMEGAVLAAGEGRRPTGETPIHLHLFRQRPDATGIVHAHPPLLTGFAIAGCDLLARPILPEPILEVGPVALVDYAEPLTDALAHTFDEALPRHNGFLMRNHGALFLSGEGCERALDFLEMTEAEAASLLAARQLGEVHELSRDDVDNLGNTMRTRGLPMPGARGAVERLADLYF
ncbi:MAG: class II aldolase/adducin family protein [Planctomycetota bacterium]